MGDDFLGHPNRSVPTPFLVPNLVGNHLAISLLLDHVGGAFDLVLTVGLSVDEGALDDGVHLLPLNLGHLLDLKALEVLVAFLMALETRHGCSLLKLVHHVIIVILRRLVFSFALQSHQVLHIPIHFFLELIILLGNEIIA